MLLLALAIAPGIAISLFIFSLNRYGRGRIGSLLISFVLGMIGTIPPFLIQMKAGDVRNAPFGHGVLSYAWFAFIIVALTEEGSKFLLVRFYAYTRKTFHQPFDGIIYAVMIGMGFATVENIEYIRQFGLETGVARFFLSVPAHASFAVLMGYNAGLAKSGQGRKGWLMARSLLIPVLLHGSYDFFLFLQQNHSVTRYVSAGLLSFGAFTTFYIAIRLALRAIRMYAEEDEMEDPVE